MFLRSSNGKRSETECKKPENGALNDKFRNSAFEDDVRSVSVNVPKRESQVPNQGVL